VKLFGLEVRVAPRLSPVPTNRGGWWPLVREPFSGAWQRNQEWTVDTVAAHHAVYACITRIAQDFGKLRPKLVEQDKDDIWSEVTNTAHSPVLRKPNRFQNHIQFKEWWITSKLLTGNAYALLERDDRNVVSKMYLLDPTKVTVLVASDGAVFYKLKEDNLSGIEGDDITIPASEIIHDRINCLFHPLVGTSPIFACGTAANMGLQIQNNSAAFFANGSNPSGILSTPVTITPQKSDDLSAIWNARFSKGASGGVAVLGDSMKFEPMRMNNVDAQLIQQLGWTAETVCSTFHVPAWKVGVGEQPAYTKPEIANQAYYSDCLQSLIEQWELCMDEALGLSTPVDGGKQLGVELDLDGLLRMDAASQITTLKEAVSGSVLTVNEARAKVDKPPVDGGDEIWMQQQNYSLPALAKRDEKADPFATTQPATPTPDPASEPPQDATRGWADLFTQETLSLRESLVLTGT
jgi:HK97 family phage portal protein